MISVISGAADTRYCPLLDGMFADRKRMFVDLLGWEVPIVDGRFEIDQFDTPQSLYIAAADRHGDHQGSLRLLPTNRPHILGNLFPSLCADGVPTGSDIYEITRLCLPARFAAAERLSTRNLLITAMVDHALASGIAALTGVVAASFRTEVLAMGWHASPLGPAHIIGGQKLGAFRIDLDLQTPELLRATGIYTPEAGARPVEEVAA